MFLFGWNYLPAVPEGAALAMFLTLLVSSHRLTPRHALRVGLPLWLLSGAVTLGIVQYMSSAAVSSAAPIHNQLGYAIGMLAVLALPFLATSAALLLGRNAFPTTRLRLLISLVIGLGYLVVLPALLFGGAVIGCAMAFASPCL